MRPIFPAPVIAIGLSIFIDGPDVEFNFGHFQLNLRPFLY